jgi:tetratricopeptide (TPR) repeat protein
MNKFCRLLISVSIASVVAACAAKKENTLGSLKYTPESEDNIEVKQISHQEVREEYKELLNLFEDKQLKEQIERRIADVYMMEGVYDQNRTTEQKDNYSQAIKAYRNILEKYPDSPDNAEVLYQLAKAYDMEGNQAEALSMLSLLTTKHPNHPNIEEAYFRKGDIHFNNGEYRQAEQAYTAVTLSTKSKYHINAYYMLGWTYYKQAAFDKSLNSFAYVVDQIVKNKSDLTGLDKAQTSLATDSIHSISLGLDRIGGYSAIAQVEAIANKPYVWLIYQDLGNYYLEKELYEDSAGTFRLFVNTYPQSSKAPMLHEKLVNAYIKGNFPRKALEEKESYVNAYGLHSNYDGNRQGMSPEIKSLIKVYLDELARHHYSEGQNYQKFIAEAAAKEKKDQAKLDEAKTQSLVMFKKAAGFYHQFAETFPEDDSIEEVYFLKAESLFLAEEYDLAIADYERVAYLAKKPVEAQRAADSGYAAIISFQKHIATLTAPEDVTKWQMGAVDSMLKFAGKFHADNRAPTVLTNAAEYLFGLSEYQKALSVTTDLVNKNPNLDKGLKKTAYGLMAHSYFKLDDFVNAEVSYLKQRELVDPKSEEYTQISERLATSIYKNTEVLAAKKEHQQATVNELLKIKHLAPNSSVRVTAQYDAATMLLEMSQWSASIVELKELIAIYPEHQLAVEFPRKLAYAYEKNENWKEAAATYLQLSQKDPDSEIRREGLFFAATMYEKDKNTIAALEQFKNYDAQYPAPFNANMEARFHVAEIYEKLQDSQNQLFWLNKIITGHQKAGKNQTDRSKWLAAWATMKYGDDSANKFRAFRFYLPLVKSLPEKNKLLDSAVKQYQLATDYGILEFVTMSSYKIAGLYQTFASELRTSPKPAGMSSDDQNVYAEIIEEQAKPFDELAVELYQANIDRAWDGKFNEWIDKSFTEIKKLLPERFNKNEVTVSYGDEIR